MAPPRITDQELGRRQREYLRSYNLAMYRAFRELAKRYPEEYQELLKKHRDQLKAERPNG